MPPNMFLAPGYSPRSSSRTLAPAWASPRAALVPAGPAPTTMASKARPSGVTAGGADRAGQRRPPIAAAGASRHALIFSMSAGRTSSRSAT